MKSLINISNIKWVCHHLHIDKSKIINTSILNQSLKHMKEKWVLMNAIKQNYTVSNLFQRMNSTIDHLHQQNCNKMRTFIDVDSTVGLMPINVAMDLKQKWKTKNVDIQIGTQPLEGLETCENIELFEKACSIVDFVGCLPSRDTNPEKHMDIVFSIAEREGKHIEAHLDQCNIPIENETEMFCNFVEKYQYYGKARAIHSVSLACRPIQYQHVIAKRLQHNGIGVIICPSAAISMTQHQEYDAPIHNSIGPLNVFIENKVNVGLGVDNIEDIFMPYCDGSLEFELRLLAESTRNYNPELLINIAENTMGFD